MSQSDKARYYRALKQAGVVFDRHYRDYSTEQLKAEYEKLVPPADGPGENPPFPELEDLPPVSAKTLAEAGQAAQGAAPPSASTPPVASRRLDEMPGERLNTKAEDEPIRVDENGLIWYQEEVRKAAYAKPRGRRVLRYFDTGTREETVREGDFTETFEVAGAGPRQAAEVKITLPSYQVGIYKDPRFPFKIHVYNENRGFDLFDVQAYYGGPELVPAEIKRIYVEGSLCYDIRTTVRAIEAEYRQLQLTGRI